MTHDGTTSNRRRRLAAAALSLPLSLAMTGSALATGGTTHEARPAALVAPAASGGTAAAEKAAAAAAEKAAAEPKPERTSAGAAAGSAAGAATATSTGGGAYVNGNTNSGKAQRPTAPVPGTPSQPLSKADKNGTGANPGERCTHNYCSSGTGLPTGNGVGDGQAVGQPCAGCVGKADNKNPKGQAPSGPVDRNAGYECDRNQGIGQTNPAHTGCTSPPTTSPTTPPTDACPNMPGNQPAGTRCNDGGGNGGGRVDVCPTMPGNQPVGTSCSDDTPPGTPATHGKITICHATGSATNPYVVITIDRNGLNGHGDHAGDIIPMAAGGCPVAGTTPGNPATGPVPPVCPTVMPVVGPVQAGCETPTTPPAAAPPAQGGGGTDTPIDGVTPDAPAAGGPPPAAGPPGTVAPGVPAAPPVPVGPPTGIRPAGLQPQIISGLPTTPSRARALPFTGTDAALLLELGALLLLAGGGIAVAARRERTARAV